MANKKEFLIDNLVESGFLFKEAESNLVIMEKHIEGFSYLKRRVAVMSDGKIIYLGITTGNDIGISTILEIDAISHAIINDERLINKLRLQAEAL